MSTQNQRRWRHRSREVSNTSCKRRWFDLIILPTESLCEIKNHTSTTLHKYYYVYSQSYLKKIKNLVVSLLECWVGWKTKTYERKTVSKFCGIKLNIQNMLKSPTLQNNPNSFFLLPLHDKAKCWIGSVVLFKKKSFHRS